MCDRVVKSPPNQGGDVTITLPELYGTLPSFSYHILSPTGHKLGLRFLGGMSPPGNFFKGDFSVDSGTVPPCKMF